MSESPNPTTCCFMNSDSNQFICGFNDGYLSVYDFNKNNFTSNIKVFKNDKNDKIYDRVNQQVNSLVSSQSIPFIYGGFEDGLIKTIDMRTGIL